MLKKIFLALISIYLVLVAAGIAPIWVEHTDHGNFMLKCTIKTHLAILALKTVKSETCSSGM